MLSCQKKNTEPQQKNPTSSLKPTSDFYPKDRAQVLVVGTFHFNYPGLDELKTEETDKIDVLKEPKKTEVTELIAYIKQFKPNKIAIESLPGYGWNSKFKEYNAGKHRDKRGERYQLAMRIALETGLDTLYTVDARSQQDEIYKRDTVLYHSFINEINWDIEDPYWEIAKQYFEYDDAQIKSNHLIDVFKHMNTRNGHNSNFGLYLTGAFSTGNGQGADNLTMGWYNRNARIFANIVNITESPKDRILVIFGNGHASILRQFFEASPQYDFIEFDSL